MRLVQLIPVALLTLLLVSCGGGDKKPAEPGSPVASTEAAWLALLDAVPDSPEARQLIVLNDYAVLRRLSDEDAPKDAAAVAEYRRKVLVAGNAARPSHISGLGQYFDPHLWSAQVGFHGGQVDADLQTGKPPNDVQAVRGRFDASVINTAIDKDTSAVRSLLTKTSREGVTEYIWGEDNKIDVQNRSVLRPLGRGERLAVKGDTLFWTHSTAPLNDMIDAAAGQKPSLADAPDVKAILHEVSKESVYTALLSTETLTPELMDVVSRDPSVVRDARDASFKEALPPYTMLAIGYGRDAEGPYSILILQHTSESLARENLTKLQAKINTGRSAQAQTPWNELITKFEATTTGVFLTAKMRTASVTLLGDTFFKRDSLLVHE